MDSHAEIEPGATEGTWRCVIREDGRTIAVELTQRSGGLFDVSALEVRSSGNGLTAAAMRDGAYATWIQDARSALTAHLAGARKASPLTRPSDLVPDSFLGDRRGREPRGDADYAALAWAFLAMPPDRQIHAAREWAERHPSLSRRTWQNHLAKARKFLTLVSDEDDDEEAATSWRLTDEGARLLFGDDYAHRLEGDDEEGHLWQEIGVRLHPERYTHDQRALARWKDERRARKEGTSVAAASAAHVRDATEGLAKMLHIDPDDVIQRL